MKVSSRRRKLIEKLFRRSWVLHRVRDRRAEIQARLRSVKRKVWPVARVARLLGVSVRLLWQWIADGAIAAYERPSEHHCKGITARAIHRFLGCLDEAGMCVFPRRQSPSPAMEKCRLALRKLAQDELLTPGKFATRAGVSVATVWRATASGSLPAVWETRRLRRICRNPNFFQKNRLTRKQARQG